jgi:ligand-binding sensor protein
MEKKYSARCIRSQEATRIEFENHLRSRDIKHRTQRAGLFQVLAFVIVAALVLPSYVSASTKRPKTQAQSLVEKTLQKHPEVDEVGIAVRTSRGCRTIASTDKSDVGEACEKDDIEPMRTGKPFVERERDGFGDVSVPLRDVQGRVVGSLGVSFKQAPGQTRAKVVEEAEKISKEMAAQIASKAALLKPEK